MRLDPPPCKMPNDDGVKYSKIERFPAYLFGDDGSVWSCSNFHGGFLGVWRKLRGMHGKTGHIKVSLVDKNGLRKASLVHHLILEAFVGPRPEGAECRHLNDNPKDNRIVNIRWGTRSENMADRVRNGKGNAGQRNGMSKMSVGDVQKIVMLLKNGESVKDVCIATGFKSSSVSAINTGRLWRSAAIGLVYPLKNRCFSDKIAEKFSISIGLLKSGISFRETMEITGISKRAVEELKKEVKRVQKKSSSKGSKTVQTVC